MPARRSSWEEKGGVGMTWFSHFWGRKAVLKLSTGHAMDTEGCLFTIWKFVLP